MNRLLQPVLAGVLTALVGFASTFAVVLAGLRAVGADQRQAASGLLALCLAMGVAAIWLGVRQRTPISVAWSTPGAALLISTGAVAGGFEAAVGAFVLCGLLIVAAGLVPVLGRAIAAIPAPVASAMLAGVLYDLCVAPVRALVEVPLMAVPIVVTWAVLSRFARQWAVPAALAVAVVAIVWTAPAGGLAGADLRPTIALTVPEWTWAAAVSLALPLFLVTMASQNVPGMAVLAGFGYRPPLRAVLVGTGLASTLAAPLGGHAVNLAAITAALAAGPDAHPDPRRRWIASVTAGAGYLVLGLGSGLATALVLLSPPVLVEAVAGLALLGALGASIASAVAEPDGRPAAVVTFLVTASGITVLGLGAAFWGLLAGGLFVLLYRRRAADPPTVDPTRPHADPNSAPEPRSTTTSEPESERGGATGAGAGVEPAAPAGAAASGVRES
ncbi:benzoate/H(+) symporter BenE family transporter [Micromonospora sp. NBC_01699]|uniref:benzoate/H(+) symporter BenE family transporter n=1 Tax=Micromonospora sp. NBC_01699 TaxID=2975984 RepID=UPI002E33D6A3|nr:benzoate/H(+) symporter BenE family transporter [Micromonospora sp. NBC_01699]